MREKIMMEKIESELKRLGASLICIFEPHLPKGWAMIEIEMMGGEELSVYGDGEKMLGSLAANGLVALRDYSDKPPMRVKDWQDAGCAVEIWQEEEEGTPNDNPMTLIKVGTNAGTRWTCGPHGASEDALHSAIRNDCLCDSSYLAKWYGMVR